MKLACAIILWAMQTSLALAQDQDLDLLNKLRGLGREQILSFRPAPGLVDLPQWKRLMYASQLSVDQRQAVRLVAARLGDPVTIRLTLQPLCSSLLSSRLQALREIETLGEPVSLQVIRALLEFPDLLAFQHPESDMFDLPYAFRALRLLADLKPENPASQLVWLRVQVSREERVTQAQQALAWLNSTALAPPLAGEALPDCLLPSGKRSVGARSGFLMDLANAVFWEDLASVPRALEALASEDPHFTLPLLRGLMSEEVGRRALALSFSRAMFPFPVVEDDAKDLTASWQALLSSEDSGASFDWSTLLDLAIKNQRSLDVLTLARVVPQAVFDKARLLRQAPTAPMRVALQAILARTGDVTAWGRIVAESASANDWVIRAAYVVRTEAAVTFLRSRASNNKLARSLVTRLANTAPNGTR